MVKLLKYLKSYWWQLILLFLLTGVQVFATLQLPALTADIINNGIVTGDITHIWQVGIMMMLLAILSAGCAVGSNYISAWVGAGFAKNIRVDIYAKIVNMNLTDFKRFSTASLTNRTTNDVNQVQQTMMMMLSMLMRAPLFCVISLVMALSTAPDMSWIIVLGVSVILGSTILIMSLAIPKYKVFQKMLDQVTLLTRESLTGLKVIRAFNNEKLEKQKFENTNAKLTKLMIKIDKIMKFENPIINFVFNGASLLCTFIGITLLTKDYAYLGNMSAFSQYVTHVMMSFLMLSMFFVMWPRANVSANRINEVLNTPERIHFKKETLGVPAHTPSVEFRNVDFSYEGAEEKVIENVSFVAKAGETTAFIGSTGSGKSTLINLVPRFYEATAGEILINGINIRDYKKEDLMAKIGLVPQRGLLFSGTIKTNIKFGAPNATDEQVIEAARIAQATDFIEKLPNKYNSHIAQGGTNVSGGQKQRLSIARAICKKPDIYIFDDSFSALDMKTDAKLRAALKPVTAEAVSLVVAQRVSTIKDAEQIIVLDSGKVVGKGTHKELLLRSKVYQGIVKSQLSDKEFEKEMKEAHA